MNERIHALALQLTGKTSIEECKLEDLRELAGQYPYYAPAQFLLLEKMKQEGDAGYGVQLQKAVLYYHNPLQFEAFISSDRFLTHVDLSEAPLNKELEEAKQEKPEIAETHNSVETTGAGMQPQLTIQPDGEITTEAEAALPNFSSDAKVDEVPGIIAAAPGADMSAPVTQTEWTLLSQPDDEDDPAIENETAVAGTPEIVNVEHEIPAVPAVVEITGDDTAQKDNISLANDILENQTGPAVAEVPAEPLAFEPFHTVDYFASQGIKLSREEAGKDRFGKQLRSFTDWLKTMKRLPVEQKVLPIDKGTEEKVQHLAEDSVHQTDILTEAMAEVWMKQGKPEKALEVYNKLSLLNPSKKAYFAAKIEHLKSS
jgi:hypothetical protein